MKSKVLTFVLVSFSLLILAACNTAGGAEPTAGPSAITPEQAVVSALTDYLEGQGAPVGQMNLQVKTIADDYARVEVISTDPAVPGGFNAFMKGENGVWTTVVSGSGMEMEQVEALGIPRSVWPEGWLSQAIQPVVTVVMTTEEAIVRALTDYLEAQGAPVGHMNFEVKAIADDYARVEVVSTDPAVPGGFNAFMTDENGVWTTVVSGSGMEKEQVEALGIPQSVWPESWLSQVPQSETAAEQPLCPDVPRPAVALFIPGEGYDITDPLSGKECFTTLDGDVPGLFQAVDGAVYYTVLQEDQFVVKRLAQDGTASLLSFTAVNRDDALLYHSFAVSPDGSHIAWSATSAGADYAGPEVSNMWLAGMDGAELVTLLHEQRSGEEDRWTPVPVRFSQDNSTLFYTLQPVGMGGIWNAYVGHYDNLYALSLGSEAEPKRIFDCGDDHQVLCIGDFIEVGGQLSTLAYVDIEERSVVIINGAGDVLNTIKPEEDYVGYPTFGPGGELVFYGADLDEGPNASFLPLAGTIYRVAPPTATYEVLASGPGLLTLFDWLDDTHVVVGHVIGGDNWDYGTAIVGLDGSLQVLDSVPNASFVDILSR